MICFMSVAFAVPFRLHLLLQTVAVVQLAARVRRPFCAAGLLLNSPVWRGRIEALHSWMSLVAAPLAPVSVTITPKSALRRAGCGVVGAPPAAASAELPPRAGGAGNPPPAPLAPCRPTSAVRGRAAPGLAEHRLAPAHAGPVAQGAAAAGSALTARRARGGSRWCCGRVGGDGAVQTVLTACTARPRGGMGGRRRRQRALVGALVGHFRCGMGGVLRSERCAGLSRGYVLQRDVRGQHALPCSPFLFYLFPRYACPYLCSSQAVHASTTTRRRQAG